MRKFRLTVLICGLLFCLTYFFHRFENAPNPNEYSRIYQLRAVVEQKTLAIDSMIARYKHLMDKSRFNGKYYSDKSFGMTLIAIPFYYSYYLLFGVCTDNEWMKYFLRIFCVTIPHIIFIIMLYLNYVYAMPHKRVREFVWLGYSLGTIIFTYSGLFYSHVTGASLAGISFILIDKKRENFSIVLSALTGFLLGLAVIVEYPFAIIAFWLLLLMAINLTGQKKITIMVVALGSFLIPVSVQLIVNYLSFGDIFSTGYAHKTSVSQVYYHSTGFFGVSLPKTESLMGILISPSRGLYYFSPFLLIAYPVMIRNLFKKNRKYPAQTVILFCIILSFTMFAASVVDWQGGWTVGPRYYIGAIPFLVIAILKIGIPAIRSKPAGNFLYALIIGSVLWGIIHCVYNSAGFPFIPESFAVPLWGFSAVLISKGYVSPNMGNLAGLTGALSLFPLFFVIVVLCEIPFFLRIRNLRNILYSRYFILILITACATVFATKFIPEGDKQLNHRHFAYIYKYLDKPADYIEQLYIIRRMDKTDITAGFDLAEQLRKKGFYSLAKTHFEKILTANPSHKKAEDNVRIITSSLNNESELYKKIKSQPGYETDPMKKAVLCVRFGDYNCAKKYLSAVSGDKKRANDAHILIDIIDTVEKYEVIPE